MVEYAPLAGTGYVTQTSLTSQLQQLSNALVAQLTPTKSLVLPAYVASDGNPIVPYAGANAGVNFSDLTVGDIPNLSGEYLSLGGGTLTGTLNSSSTATTTFAAGMNILSGCFSVDGTCVGVSSGSGTIGSGTQGQFAFYNAAGTTLTATSSLFLAQSGNVGVGNNAPVALLDVGPNHDFQFLPGYAFDTGGGSLAGGSYGAIATKYGGFYMGLADSDPSYGIDVNPVGGGNTGTRILSYSESAFCFTAGYPTIQCPIIAGNNGSLTIGNSFGGNVSTFSNSLSVQSRIGIGTLSPSATLFVEGTSSAPTVNLLVVASSTGSQLLTITPSGSVGGTTTPYSRLSVWGPDTASTSAFAVVNSASTTVFSVFDNGNSTYSGSIFQSSDQRLKTDVTSLDASSSLFAIELLNPVSYLRLDQPGTGENLGFIAQQVQQVFPQLVSTTSATALTPGGTLTLNYEGLISPIVSAIQELEQQITNLANTVAGFANSFTTSDLTYDRANGTTTSTQTRPNDQSPICITKAQLAALLAGASVSQSSGQGSETPSSDDSQATDTPPIIQINGDNPAIIQIGASYNDLGATISGPQQDLNLGLSTFVNGVAMSPVQIDTSAAATDTIDYAAADQNGLTSTSTRTVIIEAPANDNQATSTPANDNSPPLAATITAATSTTQ